MSECTHEPRYCWCEADSWAFKEGERYREALRQIVHHAREGDYAGQVNAMRAIAAEALAVVSRTQGQTPSPGVGAPTDPTSTNDTAGTEDQP